MDSLQFCYWLQGFFELHKDQHYGTLDHDQVRIIQDHLKLVFNKVTPNRSTKDVYELPVCASATIKSYPNIITYFTADNPKVDYTQMFTDTTCPDISNIKFYPGVSC